MKDELRKGRDKRRKEGRVNARFIVFAALVMTMFGVLVYGLFELQLVNGEQYAEQTGKASVKSISIRGSRGMITDVNSVVLAMSEKAYNVTFYRESNDWDYPTKMLLEAIEIIERYGSSLCVTAPLCRNAETGQWEFSFGNGISETAWNKREEMFRTNNYLTASAYPTAESCFTRLRQRYGFTPQEDGSYLFQLDKNGASVVPDMSGSSQLPVVETQVVDEATVLKIIAINVTMQDNLFLSLPIPIAQDVSFDAVSEIEGRSMSMPWMGVEVGEKRVYPNGSLAAQVIGYTGKIQNATRYYDELQPAGYALNDTIGLDGIESSMENWLTACITERQGQRVVETDPNGRVTRVLSYTEPTDGNTVKLTINAQYQAAAERCIEENVRITREVQEKQMQNSKWLETNKDKIAKRDWEKYPLVLAERGVLLVLSVKTGQVLAMAQYPKYDLNIMVAGGQGAADIILDTRRLTSNYAVQDRAEPGSIFKMVTGLAALTNGELTPTDTISDGGKFMEYTSNRSEAPTCWTTNYQAHQNLTIVEGLEKSCNYFFYTLGHRLYGQEGTERLYKYAAQMGLTSKTGIDLPGEVRSVVGNQTNLYDQTVSLREQMTDTPIIVANAIKKHLINYGASYGIEYDTARLDRCIKLLMDMAINTGSDQWVANARPIFMTELNMTRTMVMQAALMSDLWVYLNTIKWGGSQEIQMGIGQSITTLTPIAVSRYVAALGNGGTVWNPQIIDSIVSADGEILSQRSATVFNQLENVEQFLPYILKGMEGVVDEGGTAKTYFDDWKYKAGDVMAGKTGTSQMIIGGIKLDLENNAWFVALTPKDDPEIAVISFIPNGYAGARATVAARDFIGYYLDERAKVDETITLPGGNSLAP